MRRSSRAEGAWGSFINHASRPQPHSPALSDAASWTRKPRRRRPPLEVRRPWLGLFSRKERRGVDAASWWIGRGGGGGSEWTEGSLYRGALSSPIASPSSFIHFLSSFFLSYFVLSVFNPLTIGISPVSLYSLILLSLIPHTFPPLPSPHIPSLSFYPTFQYSLFPLHQPFPYPYPPSPLLYATPSFSVLPHPPTFSSSSSPTDSSSSQCSTLSSLQSPNIPPFLSLILLTPLPLFHLLLLSPLPIYLHPSSPIPALLLTSPSSHSLFLSLIHLSFLSLYPSPLPLPYPNHLYTSLRISIPPSPPSLSLFLHPSCLFTPSPFCLFSLFHLFYLLTLLSSLSSFPAPLSSFLSSSSPFPLSPQFYSSLHPFPPSFPPFRLSPFLLDWSSPPSFLPLSPPFPSSLNLLPPFSLSSPSPPLFISFLPPPLSPLPLPTLLIPFLPLLLLSLPKQALSSPPLLSPRLSWG
ncbi:hypothetical protein C7M84_019291 [Penaeus vannamei]|uniref:Uncharacterized protein n=1 Tax=Penaeus vannamei TaxID=6689 RepID=A0A423SF42_PENVA|nr:hypothetical protein C7M84_019291 [Penaeus vannamei]